MENERTYEQEIFGSEIMIGSIKTARIRCEGHIERMDKDRVLKKLFDRIMRKAEILTCRQSEPTWVSRADK